MSALSQQIVAMAARPGMTNAQLADALGVNRGYISSVLTRAASAGRACQSRAGG